MSLELEAINNLKNTLYFTHYKKESLENFSVDVHFQIGSYRDSKLIPYTPYYDCLHFEDHYMFCMGKVPQADLFSMTSILMVQTSLNNSFSKELKEIDLITILDKINSVLFFNNQYRMKNGSFSTFSMVHYDRKKEQVQILSLNQEVLYIPKDSNLDYVKCEYPEEMKNYLLGMFEVIPDINKFIVQTYPFSKGDSVLIADSLEIESDFFKDMPQEKSLFKKENSEQVLSSLFQQEIFKESFLSYIKKV